MMAFILRFLPSFAPALGPLLNPWVLLAFVLVVTGAFGSGGFFGYKAGVSKLHEHIAEQARAAVAIVVKQGQVTEKIVTRYVKVKGETQYVTVTVEKEVERYADANPGLCLDGAWRRLHDAAAANAVPAAAGLADGEIGAPPAATAIKTVTENYAACHRNADKLDGLHDWIRSQQAVR